MPLGRPDEDGTFQPTKGRFYRGGHGDLGTATTWKCPGCGATNQGRKIEQGCGACGAGDPTKGTAGQPLVAQDPPNAPPPPDVGRVRLPPGGPAPENPRGAWESGVAPRPAASSIRVLRLIEYLIDPGKLSAGEETLRRSLVGQMRYPWGTLTATIVDEVSSRQEDLLQLAHRQPGVWLGNSTVREMDAPIDNVSPGNISREAAVQRLRTYQETPMTTEPPPLPDTGVAYSLETRNDAIFLVRQLGYRLANTIALALGSIAQELEGNSEPEKFLSSAECLQLANAILQQIPDDAWPAAAPPEEPPNG